MSACWKVQQGLVSSSMPFQGAGCESFSLEEDHGPPHQGANDWFFGQCQSSPSKL
jgi:hypothetical protein